MEKLTELTKEQEALIPIIREKWLKIWLSTERANRKAAENAVCKAYGAINMAPPTTFVWFDGPDESCIASYLMSDAGPREEIVDRDNTWLFSNKRIKEVGNRFISNLPPNEASRIREFLVRGRFSVKSIREQSKYAIYGNHEASWLSFYDYFLQLGFDCCKQLEGLMEVATYAGWWWPFETVAIMTERPSGIKLDGDNKLHCDDGPSTVFPNGFEIYSIHGQSMSKEQYYENKK